MRIILASGSPRRKELLGKIYKEFEIITSDADENIECDNPGDMVEELAKRKAEAVFKKIETDEDIMVIGSDTIVYYDGEVLGKPCDESEAKSMLSMLSDRSHQVYTGVCLYLRTSDKNKPEEKTEKVITFNDVTSVEFNLIDRFDIAEYVATGSPLDKAGAYGIQDDFAKHVKGINGDYNNVMGLPVAKLYQTLKDNKLPLK